MFIVGRLHHAGSMADRVFPLLLGCTATTGKDSLAFVFLLFVMLPWPKQWRVAVVWSSDD